jgi:hypothetical protein
MDYGIACGVTRVLVDDFEGVERCREADESEEQREENDGGKGELEN